MGKPWVILQLSDVLVTASALDRPGEDNSEVRSSSYYWFPLRWSPRLFALPACLPESELHK